MLNTMASPSATSVVPVGMPYKLYADGALVKQGVFDKTGSCRSITGHHAEVHAGDGEWREARDSGAGEYRDAVNGKLANQGFQFLESSPDDEVAPDRAVHRQQYNDLLNPSSDA